MQLVPAEESDLEEAHGIGATALTDLARRQADAEGAARVPPFEPDFWRHLHAQSRGDFWIAKDAGRSVGFAASLLRGETWWLASLFVLPGWQGRGVGKALLERCLEPARRIHGRVFLATCASLANPRSVAMYTREGMLPRVPILHVHGAPAAVPAAADGVSASPLAADPATLRILENWDAAVLFPGRAADHRFLASRAESTEGWLYRDAEGRPAGYAYVHSSGKIGPLLVGNSACAAGIHRHAAARAVARSGKVDATVPGTNGAAVRFFLRDLGCRVGGVSGLLSSRSTGAWDAYVAYRPGLL